MFRFIETANAQVTYSATAPNAALSLAVAGGQDLFWDNAGNIMLIIAAVGIVVSLFYVVYQAFRSPYQNRWNTWRIRPGGHVSMWGVSKKERD